jgi:putative ABC transport system permease protein
LTDETGTIEDPVAFLAQADSVAVSTPFLEANGLALGSRIQVRGPDGVVPLTIRAKLDLQTGLARLFGGRLAIMDILAAQRLLALDGRLTEVDIGLHEGADLPQVAQAVQDVVAGRGTVERPRARGESLERLMGTQRYAMVAASVSALLVGVILTFGTMVIAVSQRRRTIGMLRLVGMRRGEVVRLILAEACSLGVLGAALGAAAGYLLARLAAPQFAALMRARLQVPIDASGGDAGSLGPVLLGLALGPASALLGALIPARETLRMHPAEVVRPSVGREAAERAGRLELLGALVIAAVAAIWVLRDHVDPVVVGNVVTQGALFGAALLSPVAMGLCVRRGGRALGRLFGPAGWLAGRNLEMRLGRLRVTSVILVVSLGGAIAAATVFASVHRTFSAWLEANFAGIDLMVGSNGRPLSAESVPFAESALRDVAGLPEVEAVEGSRVTTVRYRGASISMTAIDPVFYQSGIRRFALLQGDPREAVRGLADGSAVIANSPFAGTYDAWLGRTIALPTPAGEVRLVVAGVTIDPNDQATLYVSRDLYRERWGDRSLTLATARLKPGVGLGEGAAAIRRCCAERYGLFVGTAADFQREIEGVITQVFALVYPGVVISFLIALFSIINSLLASVEEQVRPIGIVRAIGATRGQIAWSMMMEAGTTGLFAAVLGVVVGSLAGYASLVVLGHVFRMTLLYDFPRTEVLFALVTAALLSAAAGYIPGRQAAAVKLRAALSWE